MPNREGRGMPSCEGNCDSPRQDHELQRRRRAEKPSEPLLKGEGCLAVKGPHTAAMGWLGREGSDIHDTGHSRWHPTMHQV